MLQKVNISERNKIFFVFIIGIFAISVHGIPYYYLLNKYSFSEILAVLKYMDGSFDVSPGLYLHDVLEFKSSILFIKFNHLLNQILNIEPYLFDYIYYFISSFVVFFAIFLFLRKLSLSILWSCFCSIFLVTVNPLNHIIYGYHYKVGSAATIGLVALSIMTLLIYLRYSEHIYLHSLGLLLLYFFHPLNALLYLGMVLFHFLMDFLWWHQGNRKVLIRKNIWNFILLLIFMAFSLNYSTVFIDDPDKIFVLISLIDGYFIPWMHGNNVITGGIFLGTFLFFLFAAKKREYITNSLFQFSFTAAVYILMMCLLNYAFYELKLYKLLTLDISRIYSLLIPIVFINIISVINHRLKEEGNKEISIITLLLFFVFIRNIYLFPLMILFLIYAKERRIHIYNTFLFIAITTYGVMGVIKGEFDFGNLTLYDDRVAILIWLISFVILLSYLVSKQKIPITSLALTLLLLISLFRYQSNFRYLLNQYREVNSSYIRLDEYLQQNSSKEDIFLTIEEPFSYSGIRPYFINFRTFAYGIYVSNLKKLEKEGNNVWDFELDRDFLKLFIESGYLKKGALDGYLKVNLENITAARIKEIKHIYPNFRYILIGYNTQFKEGHLPIVERFSNGTLRLFEVLLN